MFGKEEEMIEKPRLSTLDAPERYGGLLICGLNYGLPKGGTPQPTGHDRAGKIWKESEIRKLQTSHIAKRNSGLTDEQYARLEADWEQAADEGRIQFGR